MNPLLLPNPARRSPVRSVIACLLGALFLLNASICEAQARGGTIGKPALCGAAYGQILSAAPTQPPAGNLCISGPGGTNQGPAVPSLATLNVVASTYNWTCTTAPVSASLGGITLPYMPLVQACTAKANRSGVCGNANGTIVNAGPPANSVGNLCSFGPASAVTTTMVGAVPTYAWTCQGVNGGSAATCSASSPAVALRVVTPTAITGCSVSPNTPQTVPANTAATFNLGPTGNYNFTVGGTCGGTRTGHTYTTTLGTADCTVNVTACAACSISPGSPDAYGHYVNGVWVPGLPQCSP